MDRVIKGSCNDARDWVQKKKNRDVIVEEEKVEEETLKRRNRGTERWEPAKPGGGASQHWLCGWW